MTQEKTKTQTFDEPTRGGGGISFKEFIEKNIFKTSLRDLFLEMVRKPSIAECLATFTNHSSHENELEDDVLEHGEEVFSTLLLPHVVVPRFSLPELEVPSDEEDSDISEEDDYIFAYVKYSSVSRV